MAGKRLETAVAVATDALKRGLILTVETLWYGDGLTFTVGRHLPAVGEPCYAVHTYARSGRIPAGPLGCGLVEAAWWAAEHARLPDLREAVAKAEKRAGVRAVRVFCKS